MGADNGMVVDAGTNCPGCGFPLMPLGDGQAQCGAAQSLCRHAGEVFRVRGVMVEQAPAVAAQAGVEAAPASQFGLQRKVAAPSMLDESAKPEAEAK